MKIFRNRKKLVMSGLALTVAIFAGGVAYAFWTSPGAGSGSINTGSESSLLITQYGGTPMYNSTLADPSAYVASQCYYCIQMGDLGNKVTFSNQVGGPLGDVQVAMANFNPAVGSIDIAFNIYNNGSGDDNDAVPGSLIATDEQTFSVPAAPNGGYYGTYCQNIVQSDPNSTCGIANFTITFNFSSQNITLPASVTYGIQYKDAQNAGNGGVNVQMVDGSVPANIAAGTDNDPGFLLTDLASIANGDGYNAAYNGVGPGQVTNESVGTVGASNPFGEYSSAVVDGNGDDPYVPAVEFDSQLGDLYPGGPAQPINFSITNPGTTPATVTSVTVVVTGTNDNTDCNATNFAVQNGSDVSQADQTSTYTSGFPATIPAGGTVNFPATTTGAQLYMINLPVDQDGCQNKSALLTFTSN